MNSTPGGRLTVSGRRRRSAVFAVLAAVLLMVSLPATAGAAGGRGAVPAATDSADRMTSFTADYVLDTNGGASVTETIDYRFGTGAGARHGIYRSIAVRQPVNGSDEQYRYYSMRDVSVTSPTGAPANTKLIDSGDVTTIKIGDASRTVSGTQTYVVKYHLANLMNAVGQDAELFLNVFRMDQVPKDVVAVTVSGPAPSTKTRCSRGNADQPCDAATSGTPASFSLRNLRPGEDMTIATAFPLSAFSALRPDIRSKGSSVAEGPARALSSMALVGGVLVPLLAAGLMGTLVATRGRDEWYAGLTPGLSPGAAGPPASAVTGLPAGPAVRRGRSPTVAVQFTPPPGVQPGLVGTIVDESADTVDVSATVIDLAVRGFLRIEEVQGSGRFSRTDWELTRLVPPLGAQLQAYESTLLEAIFATANPVRLSALKNQFATTLGRVKEQMYAEVVRRGWFRKSPERQRRGWTFLGTILIGIGIATGWFLTAPSAALDRTGGIGIGIPSGLVLGAGLVLGGLIFHRLGARMAAKTAAGSAVLAQSLGFKQYLVTAEANQIRWEEAQDIFSRYLPYAIVFGVAEKWAGTFRQVAEAANAAGHQLLMPTWYLYAGSTFPDFGGIVSGVDSFSSTAAGTFTSTPGSSGGSGFSGGGFSGGGVGGSSSGSW